MRALRYHATGAPAAVRIDTLPVPTPSAGEVLVRVRYASLNPVDWKIADGQFRLLVRGGLPRTMGSDFAGEVAAVGSAVRGLRVGRRVWGFVDPFRRPQGTFAEYCPVPAGYVFPLPDGIAEREAAALACVGVSAVALCNLARVKDGSRVLVNGAAGGVGHVAVQVARARGSQVTGVASGGRRDFVLGLGAEAFIDHAQQPVAQWPGRYDALLDCVPNLPRSVHRRLLVRGGSVASTLPDAASFLLDPLTNALGVVRRRALMLAPHAAAMDELLAAVARGRLRCHVEAEYPLEETGSALRRSRSGHVQGKLLVRID